VKEKKKGDAKMGNKKEFFGTPHKSLENKKEGDL
jgi:hypothetical protein